MTVTVRALAPEEWRTYRAVRLAALRDAPEAFGGSYAAAAAYPEQQWIDWCGQPSWFAFDGEEPVGMVRVFRAEARPLPELVSMWVAPRARGRGVADTLVAAVLTWADAEGEPGVFLRVVSANARAIRAYERLGFRANGTTDTLPDGRPEIEMEHLFAGAGDRGPRTA